MDYLTELLNLNDIGITELIDITKSDCQKSD